MEKACLRATQKGILLPSGWMMSVAQGRRQTSCSARGESGESMTAAIRRTSDSFATQIMTAISSRLVRQIFGNIAMGVMLWVQTQAKHSVFKRVPKILMFGRSTQFKMRKGKSSLFS